MIDVEEGASVELKAEMKVRALHQKAADDVASTMSRLAAKQATPQ
jgi:hypothetical protein